MQNFHNDTFTITVIKDGPKVTMVWVGEGNIENSDSDLIPYLNNLLPELMGSELTIQYEQLEFINSQIFRAILIFIAHLNTAGINTMVTYNTKSAWQRISFKTLGTFCQKMSHITIQGI